MEKVGKGWREAGRGPTEPEEFKGVEKERERARERGRGRELGCVAGCVLLFC